MSYGKMQSEIKNVDFMEAYLLMNEKTQPPPGKTMNYDIEELEKRRSIWFAD